MTARVFTRYIVLIKQGVLESFLNDSFSGGKRKDLS